MVRGAGSRRNRVNAASMEVPVMDIKQDGPGRPSKGGGAMRSMRYYAKNHLLILQKRKIKRYTDRVKKHLIKYDYDEAVLYKEVVQGIKRNMKHWKTSLSISDTIYYLNTIRDDRYLTFLNDEADDFIKNLFKESESEYPLSTTLSSFSAEMKSNHAVIIFKLCTLLSAYLLLRHVKNLNEDDVENEEKIIGDCKRLYVTLYTHLLADELEEEEYEDSAHQSEVEDDEDPEKEKNSE